MRAAIEIEIKIERERERRTSTRGRENEEENDKTLDAKVERQAIAGAYRVDSANCVLVESSGIYISWTHYLRVS